MCLQEGSTIYVSSVVVIFAVIVYSSSHIARTEDVRSSPKNDVLKILNHTQYMEYLSQIRDILPEILHTFMLDSPSVSNEGINYPSSNGHNPEGPRYVWRTAEIYSSWHNNKYVITL